MKIFRKAIITVIVIAIAIGTYGFFEYRHFAGLEPSFPVFSFNNQPIRYQSATVKYELLWGLIPLKLNYAQSEVTKIDTDQIVNHLIVTENTMISVTLPDQTKQTYQGSQDLDFEENGEYKIELDTDPDSLSSVHYEFLAEVKSAPVIKINTLSPYQGEIVVVDISNLKFNSTIVIQSKFEPSALSQSAHEAHFYVPAAYRAAVQNYPLSILINGKSYDYTLAVQAYDFKKDYFTIDQSIIDKTTGNPLAASQFNAAIPPLYETAEPAIYWKGNFMIPVIGSHITSFFGEMRYVNNATTPTRHAAIDYGVACGTDVAASNAGKVEFAGLLILTGNTIVIDHGLGLKTIYEHMLDLNVKVGDIVTQGQLIGHVGMTGMATGCHLHFQAMIKSQNINPEYLYQLIK